MATTVMSPAQTSIKRKQSVVGLSGSGRTVKRRASKACHCCRSRKVRCDVVESGIPCTNCRLDEVECLVTEGKRRKKSYPEVESQHHTYQSPCGSISEEKEHEQSNFNMFDDVNGLPDTSISLDGMPIAEFDNLNCDVNTHQPHMLYQTQGHRLSSEERSNRISSMGPITITSSTNPTTQAYPSHSFPPPSSRPDIVLPQYIQPLPPSIMSEDLTYLHRKGVFTIPETSLRNELLRSYVQYVHPFMPVVDLEDLLVTIEKNDPNDTISLLLFQAIMFAASAYIDMRFLAAQGYDARKTARKAFFERVKLLYDFEYETDRVTIIQAVLLMTYWYENPDDPKDVWYWVNIAVSHARTIGINCNTDEAFMPVKTRRLWKRIWWCCYMRDRLVSIGMRRPMIIERDQYDVRMLELSDFDTNSMPNQISRMLGGCPAVRDSSKRVTLAKMCIGLVRLCQCITDILNVQYSTVGHKLGATKETTVRLVPRKAPADPHEVLRCDRQLEMWGDQLDPELHYFVPTSQNQERTNTHDGDVITLHRALLTGIHLTAVSALHRPQIMPSMPSLVISPELHELSKRKVRDAAYDITEIFKDVSARDLIRYLPTTGVTIILPAIIIHIMDIKSSDLHTRQASIRRFQICMQALQRLREMYASADFAFSFLDAAVRRADVNLPAHPPQKIKIQPPPMPVIQEKFQSVQQPMLTPPPEASKLAAGLLFACSLAPEERKLIAAFTPPGSDHSLNSIMTGGAAITLSDLERDNAYSLDEEENEESEPGTMNFEEQQLEANLRLENDFDALINLEGGGDLFTSDENLYNEMNMAWLNGLNDDSEQQHEQDYDMDLPMFEKHEGYEGPMHHGITGDLDADLGVRT